MENQQEADELRYSDTDKYYWADCGSLTE